ncbi:MAG: ribonuclease [Epsilonproteobacteria bacterium]|nr:MAG: ribonuclease [Campylobacterota bacterium]
METKSVFIDANIFIDVNDKSRVSYESCYILIPSLIGRGIKLYTSCDLITTIYYVLLKQGRQIALDSVENINKICKIIDFSNTEVSQTCQLMRENKKFKDLEDTLQYVLAKNTKCDLIISNDKNFYAEDMELLNSDEAVNKFKI